MKRARAPRVGPRVHPSLALLLALLALLLPAGLGLVALVPARLLRADGPTLAGLALLALAAPLGASRLQSGNDAAMTAATSAEPAAAPAATPVAAAPLGVRVEGVWRAPPGRLPFLLTADGPLDARASLDGPTPPPGTPVTALVRLGDESEPSGVGAPRPTSRTRIVMLTPTGPPRGAWIDRWARAAGERTRRLLTADNEGLVAALVLGDRSDLGHPVTADCVSTGVVHLLSLSGSHVSLMVLLLERCGAGALRLLAAPLLLFTLMAGSQGPLVRSVLCWGAHRSAQLLGRPAPPLHRLAAVFLLMEAWSPGLHAELAVQLSFLSLAGLLCAVRLVRGPLAVVAAGVGAFLATAPLCAEVFGRVQPWGVLVTPLTIPLVAVILGVGMVALVPVAAFSALDGVSAPALEWSATALRELLALLARWLPPPLRPAPFPLPVPGWLLSLLVVAALASLSYALRRRGSVAERLQ